MVLAIFLILIGVSVLIAAVSIASGIVYAKKQLAPQHSLEAEVRQAELRRKRAEAELKVSELSFRRSQMESNRQIMEATANKKLEAIQAMDFQRALEAGENDDVGLPL